MDHQVKPDLSVYSDKEPSNENLCRVRDMETFVELKLNKAADGFTDIVETLEKDTGDARDTRGQLTTYLNCMQVAQHRTHGFGVLIAKDTCRLLRHTHSGIEVTQSFNYTKTAYLQTFFWRLSHADAAIRGIDTTFEPVGPFDAAQARALLGAEDEPLWKIFVGERSFYVAAPFTRSHYDPVGRGTRCFVAVDCNTQQKCVLKDVWRLDGYHPEGEVYQRLHDNRVHNIPQVLAAGDVGNHCCGFFPDEWQVPSDSSIRRHIHYRIVLDVVGEPVFEFESTHTLVQYILHALEGMPLYCEMFYNFETFEAHFDAVTLAQVHHHDISVGNIIIVRKSDGSSVGYLIDWEFAKFSEDVGARAHEKTVSTIYA
jgi:hypothetical protein